MSKSVVFWNRTDYTFTSTADDIPLTLDKKTDGKNGDSSLSALTFEGDELTFSFNETSDTLKITWNIIEENDVYYFELRYQIGSGAPIAMSSVHDLKHEEPSRLFSVSETSFQLAFALDNDGIVIVGIEDMHPGWGGEEPVNVKPTIKFYNKRGGSGKLVLSLDPIQETNRPLVSTEEDAIKSLRFSDIPAGTQILLFENADENNPGATATLRFTMDSPQTATVWKDVDEDQGLDYVIYERSGNSSLRAKVSRVVVQMPDVSLLKVGAFYQGGIIAYILQKGDSGYTRGEVRGLLVYPKDATSDDARKFKWSTTNVSTGAIGNGILRGLGNTQKVVLSSGRALNAAKLCDKFSTRESSNWYLPSAKELQLVYQNLRRNSNRNVVKMVDLDDSEYWSSTEANANQAMCVDFEDGTVKTTGKSQSKRVRMVRYFWEVAK